MPISPFDEIANSHVVMYIEPIRNEYFRTYQNIITLSNMPIGPLAEMVKQVNLPKLSQFQSFSPFAAPLYGHRPGMGCVYVLLRYPANQCNAKDPRSYMVAEDLPSIFGYLQKNGYRIDTHIASDLAHLGINMGGVSETRMSGNRRVVCQISM